MAAAHIDTKSLLGQGLFSEMDIHFAGLMHKLSDSDSPAVFMAAALVSRATSEGHICLDLSSLPSEGPIQDPALRNFVPDSPSQWGEILLSSGVVGTPGEYKPLILDESLRLYLQRYWHYEKTLADDIRDRASRDIENIDWGLLKRGLERLFHGQGEGGINWQKIAAFTAVTKRFSVISGGPGTGKTSVISSITSLILEQAGGKNHRIAFSAPTGKAASNMEEAIKKRARGLEVDPHVLESVASGASTLHRLLGSVRNSPYFRHNRENPLPYDTVVVDEVSMVDLPLLSKLSWALPAHTRIILIGDKDQLSSVAPGSVLGDISNTGAESRFSKKAVERYIQATGDRIVLESDPNPEPIIKDSIVYLKQSYRFGGESGIGKISRAVNSLNRELALEILKNKKTSDATWQKLPSPKGLVHALRPFIIEGYAPYLRVFDPMEALNLFENFRILSALKKGPFGVAELNRISESILSEKGLINPGKKWYRGRPILITQNDYNLGLYNGDIGIILSDETRNNELRAYFPAGEDSFRKISPGFSTSTSIPSSGIGPAKISSIIAP